jgi:hypothetical protein
LPRARLAEIDPDGFEAFVEPDAISKSSDVRGRSSMQPEIDALSILSNDA